MLPPARLPAALGSGVAGRTGREPQAPAHCPGVDWFARQRARSVMRSDMKKVVTERPRGGGGVKTPKGEKRDWQRHAVEDLPKRERIRAKWDHTNGGKYFTDVLGPLYRFLLKQAGRPWDNVYSEI